jgi:hypothetical protein
MPFYHVVVGAPSPLCPSAESQGATDRICLSEQRREDLRLNRAYLPILGKWACEIRGPGILCCDGDFSASQVSNSQSEGFAPSICCGRRDTGAYFARLPVPLFTRGTSHFRVSSPHFRLISRRRRLLQHSDTKPSTAAHPVRFPMLLTCSSPHLRFFDTWTHYSTLGTSNCHMQKLAIHDT